MKAYSHKRRKILLISPEFWGRNFVSKHHYAVTMAQEGNFVYFLNPPSNHTFRVSNSSHKNLFIVDYRLLFKGIRKLPNIVSSWLTMIEVVHLERRMKVDFDIIWNFETSRFFNLSRIPSHKIRISQIVDYTEKFNLPLASATADLCIGTSDFINEQQRKFNKNVHKIHHGVQTSTLQSQVKLDSPFCIKVGYVGNLSIPYIDWSTIYIICKRNQEVSFYFIGPEGKSNLGELSNKEPYMEKVRELTNTFFLGPVPSYSIPTYLKLFDILLMVYKADQYRKQLANPHKLMEYLASGKVVVSSYTDEYKDKTDLLEMANCNQELPQLFANVKCNLTSYNSTKKMKIRTNFALANTYKKQIQRIFNLLKNCANE